MKKKLSVIGFCLLLGYTVQADSKAADSDELSAAIDYLLTFVAETDCTFIRNGKPHTAKEAVVHMQRKYEHFRDEIKTPEDFIRLSASKSLISGKPYMVKTKTGQVLKSETWLLEALETYRRTEHGKANKP